MRRQARIEEIADTLARAGVTVREFCAEAGIEPKHFYEMRKGDRQVSESRFRTLQLAAQRAVDQAQGNLRERRGPRRCLRCQEIFQSEWCGNRLCATCQTSRRTGEDLTTPRLPADDIGLKVLGRDFFK